MVSPAFAWVAIQVNHGGGWVLDLDFAGAAEEMVNSLWAYQTPARARRLADRMRELA